MREGGDFFFFLSEWARALSCTVSKKIGDREVAQAAVAYGLAEYSL